MSRARLLLAVLFTAAATAASACPACAGRAGLGKAGLVAMGSMIALPFMIVAVIIPSLKKNSPDSKP